MREWIRDLFRITIDVLIWDEDVSRVEKTLETGSPHLGWNLRVQSGVVEGKAVSTSRSRGNLG